MTVPFSTLSQTRTKKNLSVPFSGHGKKDVTNNVITLPVEINNVSTLLVTVSKMERVRCYVTGKTKALPVTPLPVSRYRQHWFSQRCIANTQRRPASWRRTFDFPDATSLVLSDNNEAATLEVVHHQTSLLEGGRGIETIPEMGVRTRFFLFPPPYYFY